MKFVKILIGILIIAIAGALVAGVLVDNKTSSDIENKLKAIELPNATTIESSVSRTGRLSDPNGPMEFYGAILLQSNTDYGSLKAHYRDRAPEGLNCNVVSLAEAQSTFGSDFPAELRFSYHDKSPEHYYVVYAFGKGEEPFPMLDYRSYIG